MPDFAVTAARLFRTAVACAPLLIAPVVAAAAPSAAPPPGTTAPDPAALQAIVASAPGKPTAFALIVDLDTGAPILDIGGGREAFPASVAKMFTTAATLRTLPLDRRLLTRLVWSSPQPVPAARPKAAGSKAKKRQKSVANLALIGGADPSLTVAHLDGFARKLLAAGVARIDQLTIDSTLFDDELPRGFDEKKTDASYRAPIDALQVNGSTMTVVVKPGPLGKAARVEIRPPSAAIVIDNQAQTTRGRADRLQVRSGAGKGQRTRVVVTGTIGVRRRAVAVRRRVHNARVFAGETFRARLEAKGIVVRKLSFGPAPTEGMKPFANRRSAPLLQLVSHCNKTSHNGYAETLFKLLGAETVGHPGTAAKAEAAMQQALAGFDIDWSEVRQGNGSGLYHANKVTPRALIGLLRGMNGDAKVGEKWRKSLAIGAVDGTLRGRFGSPATSRRIFAKTGTLDDVTALAGYAMGERRRYAFALFFNKVKGSPRPLRRVHDRLMMELLDPGAKLRKAAAANRPAPARRKARRKTRRSRGTKGKKKKTR